MGGDGNADTLTGQISDARFYNRILSADEFKQLYTMDLRANNIYVNSAGQVGIGTTSPTATLHLRAGTASASSSPLKFNSGTNLTTPEIGAVEYDGTHLFASPAGALRERIHTGWGAGGTLTAGTTTTITDARAKTTSTIILSPTSLAFTALSAYVSTKSAGSFVITTLTAAGTETFDYLIIN